MFIIREIMYCKPGKVRPLVDKFKVISDLGVKMGMPKMRIMTDFCAERYWTIVSEIEVADLNAFEQMMASMPQGSTARARNGRSTESRGAATRATDGWRSRARW